MKTKLLEIRDRGTFIPALAVEVSGADGWLARSAGYGHRCILLTPLKGGNSTYDPYDWGGSRTMHTAHVYITENFDVLENEQVIDVEFILGEKDQPSMSDRHFKY